MFLDLVTEAVWWDRHLDYKFRDYEFWFSDYDVSGCAIGKWYDPIVPQLSS